MFIDEEVQAVVSEEAVAEEAVEEAFEEGVSEEEAVPQEDDAV